MAIRKETIHLIEIGISHIKSSIHMAELGNQHCKDGHPAVITGKEYFESLGHSHTSFDLNGKDGAISIDLSKSIPLKYIDRFNIVTNYGTSEHIDDQYMVFKNIHDLVCKNGVIVHCMPLSPYWKHHGLYNYSEQFTTEIAGLNNYEIMADQVIKKVKNPLKHDLYLLGSVLIKRNDDRFISEKEFNKIKGIIRL